MNYISRKYNFFYAIALVILFLSDGCTPPSPDSQSVAGLNYTDNTGRPVRLLHAPRRVMGLAPSLTEMLFFVCDTSQIAAVTTHCNYPALVKTKPAISTYPIDFEGLLRVKPDLAFTMEGITSAADARRMEQIGIPVYFQKPEQLEDVFRDLETIGKIMGRTDRASFLADSLRTLVTQIKQQTAAWPKPKVLAITWTDPIYVYGRNTIFTDKLLVAGAQNAVDSVFEAPYPALTREYILKINPDVVLGGTFEKMDSTFFRQYPELKKTNAYRNRRIYPVNDDLNSRPGPRVIESILELKKLIHPEALSR